MQPRLIARVIEVRGEGGTIACCFDRDAVRILNRSRRKGLSAARITPATGQDMKDLAQAKALLDEINAAISGYDDVLKERARDILLEEAFGARPAPGASDEPRTLSPRAHRPGRRGRGAGGALMERWRPDAMADRALLGAFVLSGGRADRTVTSQAINAELKRHGLPVPNITRAIESGLRARPPLMVQKKKLGTTRQARKQYAMTQRGVEYVEAQLAAAAAPAQVVA
jgi:hypothetical protein